jgi:hypothetical protein
MRTRRYAGQAAVEGIGITVVLALLVAATAAWVAGAVHPGRPPDVVGRVSEPLRGPFDPRPWEAPASPPFLGLSSAHRGSAPIGRALRAVARGTVTGVVVGMQARRQFREGFAERFRERVAEFVHDPLGDPGDLLEGDALTPRGIALALIRDSGELWDYAMFLRTLPPRVALMTASRDMGHLTADVGVEAGKTALRRWLMRGARGAPPRPAGDPRPAPRP